MEGLTFLDLERLTCYWESGRPLAKKSPTFTSVKQFQWMSTERLLISSNWWWYRLQRIVYCSHIIFLPIKGLGAPKCWGPLAVAQLGV